jgi:NTP pyrophosphatase (non-canonical NTP hydrolase)
MPDLFDDFDEESWEDYDHSDFTFDEYAAHAMDKAIYPGSLVYPVLGLTGEAGEVAEKLKKFFRDSDHEMELDDPMVEMTSDFRMQMALELGDVLWYVTAAASDLGYELSEIAAMNMDKLQDRQERHKLQGSGDLR